jgi:hypothetical protein
MSTRLETPSLDVHSHSETRTAQKPESDSSRRLGRKIAVITGGSSGVGLATAEIGVALKTMSNYLDHISPNELDQPFRSEG